MQKKIDWKLNKTKYDIHIFIKSRAIDPLIKINKNVRKFSEIDKNWTRMIQTDSRPKEYFIRFNN